MNARRRSYGVSLAAVLSLAVLLIWSGNWVWLHLVRLQADLTAVQSESFHQAANADAKMRILTEILLLLDAHLDSANVAEFHKQAAEMKLWIKASRWSVTTDEQRKLLDRIETAFESYSRKAGSVLEENLRADRGTGPKPAVEQVERETALVIGLAQELRVAEQEALRRFVISSRRSVTSLFLHVLVTIGLAFLLGLAALRLIHVARIAPLRAELVQSQSVLEQKEKLAALGTLAAGVAHEVRNPLTAISVRLHSLKRAAGGDPSAADDLSVIHHEIKRVGRIVEDFLQFARPSAPKAETFDVASLFEQVIRLLNPQMKEAGVEWKLEAAPDVMALADPQQIEQVLINLIRNAVENMKPGGSITLRARPDQIDGPSGTAPGTILEVADTGEGIPPEVAKRMFDPFYSTKPNGTGLGLSIAARIIEKHGGQLQYQTRIGLGTTFIVMLPSARGIEHESS